MITLERIQDFEEGMVYPHYVAGARACPPEDCGGPPGYQNLLSILADPQHPEHEEFRRWAPEGFDPESCDVKVVNLALGRGRRPRQSLRMWSFPTLPLPCFLRGGSTGRVERSRGTCGVGLRRTLRRP